LALTLKRTVKLNHIGLFLELQELVLTNERKRRGQQLAVEQFLFLIKRLLEVGTATSAQPKSRPFTSSRLA